MNQKRQGSEKIKYLYIPVFAAVMFITIGYKSLGNEQSFFSFLQQNANCTITRITGTPVYDAKLTFTGDIMVHSYQYNEAYNEDTGKYDFNHNFSDVKKYFDDSDFVVGNFETVMAGENIGISDYPCFNSPDSIAEAISNVGFDLVTTANNHCMDKGMKGTLRTLDILDENSIDHIGTYSSEDERADIYINSINGINIAFLSYTYGTNGIRVPEKWLVNIMSEDLIESDIQRAKELNPDLIVVLPHMGNEYETYTRGEFKNWAELMLNAGADIVVASHPHVLQPMEIIDITEDDGTQRKGFVMYSMGNFISSQTTPPRNASIILNIELEKKNDNTNIMSVSFIPIWTQFRNASNTANYFVVRSVYEMLTMNDADLKNTIRKTDLSRLRDIHYETTKLLLNDEIPIENIQDEYLFYGKML